MGFMMKNEKDMKYSSLVRNHIDADDNYFILP